MITFSIPCWLFWFVSGNLTSAVILITWALIVGTRKQKAAKQQSESDNHR